VLIACQPLAGKLVLAADSFLSISGGYFRVAECHSKMARSH